MGHDVALPGLPREVSTVHVGKEFGQVKIEGIIPKGSVYTLRQLKMRREDFSTVISYVGDMQTMGGGIIVGLISDDVQPNRYLNDPMDVVFFSNIMELRQQGELGSPN